MSKTPISTQVPHDLKERVRATILGLQKAGQAVTLTDATTEALALWCEEQEAAHNQGKPFESEPQAALRPGRRIA